MSALKSVIWIGSSLEDLRKFPEQVRDEIGYALYEVQKCEMPAGAKPLKGISGVVEIRTDHQTDTYRTVYAVKLGKKLYVLHTFKKKSKKGISTPKPDMNLIRARLKIARRLAKEEE